MSSPLITIMAYDSVDTASRIMTQNQIKHLVVLEEDNRICGLLSVTDITKHLAVENIGARRLATILERLVEDISFDAPDKAGETIRIDKEYVDERIGKMAADTDLSRFVL